MTTQKGDPYAKQFSTLSAVRLVSQLHILCTSVAKQYYTKILIHLIHGSHLMATLHFLKAK